MCENRFIYRYTVYGEEYSLYCFDKKDVINTNVKILTKFEDFVEYRYILDRLTGEMMSLRYFKANYKELLSYVEDMKGW